MFNFIFTKKMRMFVIGLLMNVILVGVISAQTRIAVLPFTPDEKISKAAMSYLTEIFTFEMVNSRKFTVVERAKLDAALKEMQLQSGDLFDEGSAVELGKMAGAEMVFFGSIFRFGNKELLSVKGMDIKTATLKYVKQEKGGIESKLEKAIKLIAKQIIDETVGVDDVAKDEASVMNRLQNERNNGKSISFSVSQQKVLNKYIIDKWGIEPDCKEDMLHYYKSHKGGGIAMVVVGGIFLVSGAICVGLIIPPTIAAGVPLLVCGIVLTPLCSIPFYFAQNIATIYRKSTGQKLSFFDRTSIGGGYDWDKKEVTVAMAIKL